MHLNLGSETQRNHHRDLDIKIEELCVREDGGVKGKRREVNGENVIRGQIYLVFFNPIEMNIEDERVMSDSVNTKGREEAVEVRDKGFTGGIKQNPERRSGRREP